MASYISLKALAILALALAFCVQGIIEIEADKLKDRIENDQCIEACGLDRTMLGISSDSLLESQFTHKLCSTQCYDNCPNIMNLYFNLAAGEGVFLPKFCEAQGANARRGMAEIKSSGHMAPGPESEDLNFLKSQYSYPNLNTLRAALRYPNRSWAKLLNFEPTYRYCNRRKTRVTDFLLEPSPEPDPSLPQINLIPLTAE
ncbi:hypothetical protein TEA_017370 [Camellia sinensis var. sinensis]|uniref:Bifunctional inhibitor/plant lipid transfer protein/seed storage helical domain-containing protein n=1 Tax=Camellia sinensis var. sinensis TaxID=542762 RepID=A0A4S4D4U7_CAMSN|nr:hypothetical protein TEA_017370 [Camellia sinensis var. sinensis]